jgi:hypothetical protein
MAEDRKSDDGRTHFEEGVSNRSTYKPSVPPNYNPPPPAHVPPPPAKQGK